MVLIRKNIDSLSTQELDGIRGVYRALQSIHDNRGYGYLAGYHGLPNFYCTHHVELFLPWHRAYLHWFENFMQDHMEENGIASLGIPYWNWWNWQTDSSGGSGIPAAFSNPTDLKLNPTGDISQNHPENVNPEQKGNPLFRSRMRILAWPEPEARYTKRFPGDANELRKLTGKAYLLSRSTFSEFTSKLEDNPHDMIHDWVGSAPSGYPVEWGDMGFVAYAAFDPIFWSHHSMIDFLWHEWQLVHGVGNIPDGLMNRVLRPFTLTVKDVLDIKNLGYDYV